MITKLGMPFKGLKDAGFSGSYKGMRFFVKSYEEEKITAFVYPEPYNFDKTPEENKEKEEFPFTKEGVDKCIAWLNKKYTDEEEKWTSVFMSRNDANRGDK